MSNAERALLSCISQDPAVIGSEVVGVFQKDIPFRDAVCRRIYQAWLMTGDAATWDVPTLLDKLSGSVYACDWFSELRGVMNTTPSTEGWRSYLNAVRVEHVRLLAERELQDGLHKLATTEDVTAHLLDVSKKLVTLDVSNEEDISVEEAMEKELERRRNKQLTVCTGIEKIDRHVAPLIPGEVFILAARPSVGKSVMAHNIIKNIAMNDCPVGLFSLEMPIPQVIARIISGVAEYDSRMVLDNMHQQKIHSAYEWVKSLPIYYDDRPGLHIAQIVNKIRRWHANHGIKAIVVDYIQLIKTNDRKSNEAIGNALKEIKNICAELEIVPIVLAQINRAGAKNENGHPTLEDLKGSGSLEEDASYVTLMHRNIMFGPEQREHVNNGGAVDLEIMLAKNRHGSTGYNRLSFIPLHCTVVDKRIEDEDIPDETQAEEEACT